MRTFDDSTSRPPYPPFPTRVLDTRSPTHTQVVELAMALMTFGCCIFYMAFAGDLFSALAGTVSSFPAVLKKRAVDLVILGLCPLLPLCLMKNLSALQVNSDLYLKQPVFYVAFHMDAQKKQLSSRTSMNWFFTMVLTKTLDDLRPCVCVALRSFMPSN